MSLIINLFSMILSSGSSDACRGASSFAWRQLQHSFHRSMDDHSSLLFDGEASSLGRMLDGDNLLRRDD
jgi:hypothetical protein